MLKPFLPLLAVSLFALISVPLLGHSPQEPAATPDAAPDQSAAPAKPAAEKNPVVKPSAESQAKAKNIYKIDCALCHGDSGNGKTDVATGMGVTLGDWTDANTLAAKQDGELFNIIRNGKGNMPAEAVGRANDTEVWNLIIYIRSLSKTAAAK
jgi:mono/diheme cytochrome c family protein